MVLGEKRGRHEDELAGVSAVIAGMTAEMDGIAESVGRVNGAVIASILARAQEAERALEASRDSSGTLCRLLTDGQQRRAAAVLTCALARDEAHRQSVSALALRRQLETAASAAADEVVRGLGAAHDAAVALFAAQLDGERVASDALLRHVRDFLGDALDAIRASARRALLAELALAKRGVAEGRLRRAVSVLEGEARRHREEVLALMRIVRLLAARSRDVDAANAELRRAKAHVRLLERHLDLSGVARAIVPPSFVPPRPPPEAPPEALRRTAPEYFALRLLEQRDVTLSELVDVWQRQEERIADAEGRYTALEAAVEDMRREAVGVHHAFLEERRRREMVEQRLTDLVRERVLPSGAEGLAQQLARLRADHTRAMDDAAQTSAALSAAREELEAERQRSAALDTALRAARTDADGDELARTLSALRAHYDAAVRSLQAEAMDAGAAEAAAQQSAEAHRAAAQQSAEAQRAATASALAAADALRRAETDRAAPLPLSASASASAAQSAVARSAAHLRASVAAGAAAVGRAERRRAGDAEAFGRQLGALSDAVGSALMAPRVGGDVGAPSSLACAAGEAAVRAARRAALGRALQFLSDHLAANDAAAAALLDAAISDASAADTLLARVRGLTLERDAARAALAQCERLVDAHSLAVAERVLRPTGAAADAMDATDAAEQIAALREEVAALEAVRRAAVAEAEGAAKDARDARAETDAVHSRAALLERHSDRAAAAVREAFGREARLAAEVCRLECRVREGGGREVSAAAVPLAPDADGWEALERLGGGVAAVAAAWAAARDALAAPPPGREAEEWTRRGIGRVADALRGALQRAECFRHALPDSAAECPAPNDETEKLRGELENMRLAQEELKRQNADLLSKVERMIKMNKQLVEQLKASHAQQQTPPR